MPSNTNHNKTKIFGIGTSGLIGTKLTNLLEDRYEIDNLSIETGVDITNPATLSVISDDREHRFVLLLAAKADVDGCEKDKHLGKEGPAWKINVDGVQNVVDACLKAGKKLIYFSTDFVFNGQSTPHGGYTEEDTPDPINWYSTTKYEGEKIVRSSQIDSIILRTAYPFRTPFNDKKDFVQVILSRLKANEPLKGVTDHIMTPTYVNDIATAIDLLIKNEAKGTYHVVGSEFITPFDAIIKIAELFDLSTDYVERTTRAEFFKDRAPRPYNLSLKNAKIQQLGANMKTFEEGLALLKKEI